MLKKIAFFSIMVEKTWICAYFCSMTYKKTNRRDDDSRGSKGSDRGAKSREYGAKSSDRGARSSDRYSSDKPERKSYSSDRPERGAKSSDRYSSDRPERKSYSSDRPERKSYSSDRPERGAKSSDRGARSSDRYSSDRPERKSYSSDKPERKSYSSDRPERKSYSSDRPERGAKSSDRGARSSDRYSSDRPERKSYSSDRPERKSYSSDRPERGARSTERYPSDKPKRKTNTSRTPAAKPGPFDKFDVQKMREAKTESLEKKERRRPNPRRDAERRDSRSEGSERGTRSSREYGADERAPRAERSPRTESTERRAPREERSRAEETKERGTRERASEREPIKKESEGYERKKTNPDDEIRLNRYIANSGVCSRRKADELIEKGEVTVNGEVVRELGYKVKYSDKIKFEGKLLKPGKLVYVLLNKPKDYITTMDDPMERRTVVDLTAKVTNERIFPVGRLDRNTTGLLLLTNDGDLADKLSHPRNQVRKVYEVELDKSLVAKDFEKVREGVELEDGSAKVDQISYLEGKSKKFVGVEIHIGRNRIVRRIFESLGYEVVRLDRVIYAGLTKKDLPRGRSRMLSKEEIIYLKHLNKY